MQPFDVFLSEAALTDLEDVVEYYNEKLPGLGFRFFRQAEASLKGLLITHTFIPDDTRM